MEVRKVLIISLTEAQEVVAEHTAREFQALAPEDFAKVLMNGEVPHVGDFSISTIKEYFHKNKLGEPLSRANDGADVAISNGGCLSMVWVPK